ncbi:MAG: hypothetical protein JXA57_20420 [Armatimonadetes bacterium]|nr:hypothetical protein [Armatimonadota bacterium]
MKVFIDTMVYLHYRSLEEIDLPSLLDVGQVSVVIPRITLRELDKHKNSHSSSRVRDRARKILVKMEDWTRAGAGPRANVKAEMFLTTPNNADVTKHGLNPAWNDDVLIASLLAYRSSHPEEDVGLITQDSGPRLTAESLGILVLQLPDEFQLPLEPDPLEIENRELKKDLERLKNARPELVVSFAGDEEGTTFARFALSSPPDPIDKDIERKIQELRSALSGQHLPQPKPLNPEGSIGLLAQMLAASGGLDLIAPAEYERYNRDLEIYLSEYEDHLRRTWELEAFVLRGIRFEIEIRNVGTAPAEDVDVEFHFPDGFRLLSEEDLPEAPAEPRPPREPRTQIQLALGNAAYLPIFRPPTLSVPDLRMPTSFKIRRTGSYTVSDHFARIKHGKSVTLPEVLLVFDSFESATAFKCGYALTAANLPDPVTGNLHFVIEKENVDSGAESAE